MAVSQEFDPYQAWLGVFSGDKPPNHYLLLGLEVFESDATTIRAAAERRLDLLQQLDAAAHGEQRRQLVREITAARACLLDADARAFYDEELAGKLGASPSRAPAKAAACAPAAAKAPPARSSATGGSESEKRPAIARPANQPADVQNERPVAAATVTPCKVPPSTEPGLPIVRVDDPGVAGVRGARAKRRRDSGELPAKLDLSGLAGATGTSEPQPAPTNTARFRSVPAGAASRPLSKPQGAQRGVARRGRNTSRLHPMWIALAACGGSALVVILLMVGLLSLTSGSPETPRSPTLPQPATRTAPSGARGALPRAALSPVVKQRTAEEQAQLRERQQSFAAMGREQEQQLQTEQKQNARKKPGNGRKKKAN